MKEARRFNEKMIKSGFVQLVRKQGETEAGVGELKTLRNQVFKMLKERKGKVVSKCY